MRPNVEKVWNLGKSQWTSNKVPIKRDKMHSYSKIVKTSSETRSFVSVLSLKNLFCLFTKFIIFHSIPRNIDIMFACAPDCLYSQSLLISIRRSLAYATCSFPHPYSHLHLHLKTGIPLGKGGLLCVLMHTIWSLW